MIGWIDASSGASGDMFLGALVGAGVPVEVLQDAVSAVAPEPVQLRVEQVTRNGFAATRCHVEVADSSSHRTWADVRALLEGAELDAAVRERAVATFARLAEAEAVAHGTSADKVHFHEVGALDAIADVVGACAGLVHLGLDRLHCSPVAVGGGSVAAAHGRIAVPVPAVVELLRGLPTYGGPVELELSTPTGAALLAAWVDEVGPQPAMTVEGVGTGAGGRDPEGHANVLRLLVGTAVTGGTAPTTSPALVIESNVDDLDPRLWPDVLRALLRAGASDAWLTPIVMKKGRPAHTLHVLVGAEVADAVRTEVFRHTSTIGVREHAVAKHALARRTEQVHVDGHPIDVKVTVLDGAVVNANPEYDHVVAAAEALGRPVKEVLAEASAATRSLT